MTGIKAATKQRFMSNQQSNAMQEQHGDISLSKELIWSAHLYHGNCWAAFDHKICIKKEVFSGFAEELAMVLFSLTRSVEITETSVTRSDPVPKV